MKAVRQAAFVYGRRNRIRKARFALLIAERVNAHSALLVGVSGTRNPVNNLIEDKLARNLAFVVASGISGDCDGWDRFVAADGRLLPFRDQAFDLVYANAVIEHVGGLEDQQRFVEEIARVGRAWIITTPNRWFPIEAHRHTFFTHWMPGWAPRGGITRLLGVRDLKEIAPLGQVKGLPLLSPTLTVVGVSPPRTGSPTDDA